MVNFKNIFETEPNLEQAQFLLNKVGLSPYSFRNTLINLPKITEIIKISTPQQPEITDFGITNPEPSVSITSTSSKTVISSKKIQNVVSLEVGMEQILKVLNKYITKKSNSSITKITYAHTIKAIKKTLKLKDSDKEKDEDIWTNAVKIGKDAGYRTTPKTIFFN